ncbi:hypothetical protein GC093_20435 [Paenibacillus sp. LMG 31456]|uniref:Phage tail collar domain-containing protein n=1 Tax=Paenibacillus foliorum TaxID=2654974 RepID=A0A972GW64_9BACL|nr:hypothetical protein [Paenibacillus foliorum]NOU95579.1 hypothetical protein [Paenibacillus foliorum]
MVLTQLGLALYSKAQTGVQLNFTRMQIGSGQLALGQDPMMLAALITPVSFFSIISASSSGNLSRVKGIFENSGVVVGTYSCELGLFATDPTLGEILYAYANAGSQGDTIPPISAGPFSKHYQINTAIGNASSISATIPAETYIPISEKGVAGGVSPLDASAKIPASNLPQIDHSALLNKGSYTHAQIDSHIGATAAHGSTSAATPSTIMQRDVNGQASIGTPTSATHIARKQDVDAVSNAAQAAQTTANAALPATSYTASDVLAKLKTVDGAGSGLDTDVVRGVNIFLQNQSDPVNSVGLSQQLQWRAFGTGHTIFDASNGQAPNGAVINNSNSSSAWQASYPTLMGWNGSGSYGVRVDSARNADTANGVLIRLNSGILEFWDGSTWKAVGGVKSVQRGRVAARVGTTNITVSSVNMSKSHLTFPNVYNSSSTGGYFAVSMDASLTSPTNIAIVNDGAVGLTVSWELVEF